MQIEMYQKSIDNLCQAHHVKKMYAFGSILTPKFSETSDVDILVQFEEMEIQSYFINYLSLKNDLENIFNRKVDLVEEQTLKNPILIRSINHNRKKIYG